MVNQVSTIISEYHNHNPICIFRTAESVESREDTIDLQPTRDSSTNRPQQSTILSSMERSGITHTESPKPGNLGMSTICILCKDRPPNHHYPMSYSKSCTTIACNICSRIRHTGGAPNNHVRIIGPLQILQQPCDLQ